MLADPEALAREDAQWQALRGYALMVEDGRIANFEQVWLEVDDGQLRVSVTMQNAKDYL
jgi:hypothetical protein